MGENGGAMMEPYFEDIRLSGSEPYPFSCSVSHSKGMDFLIHPHWHYYIEILYFLSGQARIYMGRDSYVAASGDMVLISACEVHSITAERGCDTRYIVIKFDPEILYTQKAVFELKYILPFILGNVSYQKVFLGREIEDTPVPALIEEIYHEFCTKEYGFELAVQTGIGRIFLWILRNWRQKGVYCDMCWVLKEVDMQRFQKLFDYVNHNYRQDISTLMAAKICNMSYSYFSRKFKEITGKTFTEYLNYVRIREAEKLLLTTDMNITQVALNTGFSSTSYFIKQFRHYKRISPKKFREEAFQ
jgi:AraC-like DNA-binding protein